MLPTNRYNFKFSITCRNLIKVLNTNMPTLQFELRFREESFFKLKILNFAIISKNFGGTHRHSNRVWGVYLCTSGFFSKPPQNHKNLKKR